jgi:hypothetical protein
VVKVRRQGVQRFGADGLQSIIPLHGTAAPFWLGQAALAHDGVHTEKPEPVNVLQVRFAPQGDATAAGIARVVGRAGARVAGRRVDRGARVDRRVGRVDRRVRRILRARRVGRGIVAAACSEGDREKAKRLHHPTRIEEVARTGECARVTSRLPATRQNRHTGASYPAGLRVSTINAVTRVDPG